MPITFVLLVLFILLSVITVLTVICVLQTRIIRQMNDREYRGQHFDRSSWFVALKEKDEQYQALVQSYLRQEGKTFIPPVVRPDKLAPHEPRAFAMKPPPPMVSVTRNSGSSGSAESAGSSGSIGGGNK